jgi:hypothetical protein
MTPNERIEELFNSFISTMMNIEAFRSDTDGSYIGYEFMIQRAIESAKARADETDKAGIRIFEQKIKNLPTYSKLVHSMTVVYAVSKFESFLTDCYDQLLSWNQNALKTAKQISYKEVLEFKNIEDLFQALKDRELLEFSFSSFAQKIQTLEKKFNINFSNHDVNIETITEILTTRNIHLHNDGFINEVYLKNNSRTDYKIGDERTIDVGYSIHVISELIHAGESIQKKILEKIERT